MKFFNRHYMLTIVLLYFVAKIKSTNEIQKSEFTPYRGVCWHKTTETWHAMIYIGGNIKKSISGGCWKNDLDAAKMVNKICDKYNVPHKNEGMGAQPIEQKKTKKSQYKGVTWNNNRKKWAVYVHVGFEENVNGKRKRKLISGKVWDSELDAAKQVNKICDLYRLKHKNPGIGSEPNNTKNYKSSDYKCVTWNKYLEKWAAYVFIKSTKDENGKPKQTRIYGGAWDSEIDAAKQVNKICDFYGLKHKNPGIGSEPNQYKKNKNSQYKGVSWNSHVKKWTVLVIVPFIKDEYGHIKKKPISGKVWNTELDAAKQVNNICDLYGLKHKNPGIGSEPEQNKKNKSKKSMDLSHGEIFDESLEENSKNEHIKNTQEPHDSKKRKREDKKQNVQRILNDENWKINYNDFYFKSDYLLNQKE